MPTSWNLVGRSNDAARMTPLSFVWHPHRQLHISLTNRLHFSQFSFRSVSGWPSSFSGVRPIAIRHVVRTTTHRKSPCTYRVPDITMYVPLRLRKSPCTCTISLPRHLPMEALICEPTPTPYLTDCKISFQLSFFIPLTVYQAYDYQRLGEKLPFLSIFPFLSNLTAIKWKKNVIVQKSCWGPQMYSAISSFKIAPSMTYRNGVSKSRRVF